MDLTPESLSAVQAAWEYFVAAMETDIDPKIEQEIGIHLHHIAEVSVGEAHDIAAEAFGFWSAYQGTPPHLERLIQYRFNAAFVRLEKLAQAAGLTPSEVE